MQGKSRSTAYLFGINIINAAKLCGSPDLTLYLTAKPANYFKVSLVNFFIPSCYVVSIAGGADSFAGKESEDIGIFVKGRVYFPFTVVIHVFQSHICIVFHPYIIIDAKKPIIGCIR